MTNHLTRAKRVHCVGIGGIGVSALARFFIEEGKMVSGSDTEVSGITEQLQLLGIEVYKGHDKENVHSDTDLVVYTPAVEHDNIELERARELGIPQISYPEALGLLSKDRFTIAVSGTHGKTTTTAMISDVMSSAGLDPTVIVGSLLSGRKSNFVSGGSRYFVVEACEYKRSFLHLHPDILVVTNVDTDHLDYYRDLSDIQHAFRELVERVPSDGSVVCNIGNTKIRPVLRNTQTRIVNYLSYLDENISLSVPGDHNKQNAAATLAVADVLGIDSRVALEALLGFKGTWRRFEYKGQMSSGAKIYDDYAHHPTEVQVTLRAFRDKFPTERLVVVFQPHLYSRTKLLMNDFAGSFGDADEVLITPIYAAREKKDPSVNSTHLARAIGQRHQNVTHHRNFEDVVKKLQSSAQKESVVITMGAGDITSIGAMLL